MKHMKSDIVHESRPAVMCPVQEETRISTM